MTFDYELQNETTACVYGNQAVVFGFFMMSMDRVLLCTVDTYKLLSFIKRNVMV